LDLLPMNEYKISPDMRTGDKLGVILTSRGCPFDCIFCSNRQKAWQVGFHPDGVEYFIIQTVPIDHIMNDYPDWQQHLQRIENNNDFHLLYKDDIVVIYQNLKPSAIPRSEKILGWDILLRTNPFFLFWK